jgi:hypothetical protein
MRGSKTSSIYWLGAFVAKKLLEWRSFKTDRKILVIESDDWGSRRTDDVDALRHLNKINSAVRQDRFTQLDNIASEHDLSYLYEVLSSVKDTNGCFAKITANVSVANPDFRAIEESGFSKFSYEPFYKTIQRKTNGQRILTLWDEGIKTGIFVPQLHGREHVHALAWMSELRLGNADLIKAFRLGACGIPYRPLLKLRRKNLQAALDAYGIDGEIDFQTAWLAESSKMFKEYFGFHSDTFIAPAYTWPSSLLTSFHSLGIKGLQGIRLQYEPTGDDRMYKKRWHYTGQGTDKGIAYLVRNVFFEPASNPQNDLADITLSKIANAFKHSFPVIIGSHRINYIGSLDATNRDRNLNSLKQILKSVLKKYPTVEFMSSNQLLSLTAK